ncbi:YobA family protein [Saccharibacillus sp. CPCC 101409]|uniref:YobA family protein n=1 Tax=Saccharibacillus sp. CPCC 101409 TaxID=3058041 RepID=UPI0026721D4D|nr:YobA family protein [Saccharibacillus sp. CPCC 101409]MDO3411286.1 YobA family protein [Saccharibacillus sp. CPCC 101409]
MAILRAAPFLALLLFAWGLGACGAKNVQPDAPRQPAQGQGADSAGGSSGGSDADGDVEPGEEFPGLVGYVVEKSGTGILVVSPKSQDFSANGGDSEYYDATWFSGAPEEIQIGMKVEAWAKGNVVLESYPGQAGAEKVNILQADAPEGADLPEADVIRAAIGQIDIDEGDFAIVRGAEYDPAADRWNVELLNGSGLQRTPVSIEIEDKA